MSLTPLSKAVVQGLRDWFDEHPDKYLERQDIGSVARRVTNRLLDAGFPREVKAPDPLSFHIVEHTPECAISGVLRATQQTHDGDILELPACTCDRDERLARVLGVQPRPSALQTAIAGLKPDPDEPKSPAYRDLYGRVVHDGDVVSPPSPTAEDEAFRDAEDIRRHGRIGPVFEA